MEASQRLKLVFFCVPVYNQLVRKDPLLRFAFGRGLVNDFSQCVYKEPVYSELSKLDASKTQPEIFETIWKECIEGKTPSIARLHDNEVTFEFPSDTSLSKICSTLLEVQLFANAPIHGEDRKKDPQSIVSVCNTRLAHYHFSLADLLMAEKSHELAIPVCCLRRKMILLFTLKNSTLDGKSLLERMSEPSVKTALSQSMQERDAFIAHLKKACMKSKQFFTSIQSPFIGYYERAMHDSTVKYAKTIVGTKTIEIHIPGEIFHPMIQEIPTLTSEEDEMIPSLEFFKHHAEMALSRLCGSFFIAEDVMFLLEYMRLNAELGVEQIKPQIKSSEAERCARKVNPDARKLLIAVTIEVFCDMLRMACGAGATAYFRDIEDHSLPKPDLEARTRLSTQPLQSELEARASALISNWKKLKDESQERNASIDDYATVLDSFYIGMSGDDCESLTRASMVTFRCFQYRLDHATSSLSKGTDLGHRLLYNMQNLLRHYFLATQVGAVKRNETIEVTTTGRLVPSMISSKPTVKRPSWIETKLKATADEWSGQYKDAHEIVRKWALSQGGEKVQIEFDFNKGLGCHVHTVATPEAVKLGAWTDLPVFVIELTNNSQAIQAAQFYCGLKKFLVCSDMLICCKPRKRSETKEKKKQKKKQEKEEDREEDITACTETHCLTEIGCVKLQEAIQKAQFNCIVRHKLPLTITSNFNVYHSFGSLYEPQALLEDMKVAGDDDHCVQYVWCNTSSNEFAVDTETLFGDGAASAVSMFPITLHKTDSFDLVAMFQKARLLMPANGLPIAPVWLSSAETQERILDPSKLRADAFAKCIFTDESEKKKRNALGRIEELFLRPKGCCLVVVRRIDWERVVPLIKIVAIHYLCVTVQLERVHRNLDAIIVRLYHEG